MLTLQQAKYEEPDVLDQAALHPLVLHLQETPDKNNHLIIFIHGLGGNRYGKKATWGDFPKFVFEDIPQLDVGLYEYRTLFRRLILWKSIPLREEAKILAEIIRDELSNYKTIILVGHSMGGLLCKAVISSLVSTGERDTLSRIGGLILMASPQLGSLRILSFLSYLSSDFQALKTHGDFVTEINEIFENHLYQDEHINAIGKTTIPTWAVRGASDFWVDQLSSGIGLESNRIKVIHGSHTEIVKPKSRDIGAYFWVRDRIKICLSRFKYDVFLSSAMAGLKTEEDYQTYRTEALNLEKILKEKCGFKSIFYAGRNLETMAEFQAHNLSLQDDFFALKESRYFLLMYPERIVSSVLFEAGWALALGKPSVYYVRDRDDLPFLMAQAGDAHLDAKVTIYEYGKKGREEIFHLIKEHGEKLWSLTAV
ncbi:MAG: esterase/lipase family protein [Methylobacter sp.]